VLNASKTKCLVIYKKPFITNNLQKLKINTSQIDYVKQAENLGFTFNEKLTWDAHINKSICRTMFKLRTLRYTQYLLPMKVRLLIAKTYLIPTLFYGIEVFSKCSYISKQRLEVAFNDIARYVFAIKRGEHITSSANQIFGISFENLLKCRVLIFLQKIIHTKEPSYLYNKLQFTRSNCINNIVPKLFNLANSKYQFYIHAVRLWNELPFDLKCIEFFSKYRAELKKLLASHE